MTEPTSRRKVSGGAHPGCRHGGCAFGAAQWEHPPRPALRTLILPGGRRRPGGAAGSPAPSAGSRLAAGLRATTVSGKEGRRRPGPGRHVLLVTLRLTGYELWGSPQRGASLHREGGARARRRHEHRKEAGSIRGGAGARPTAQLWSALGNFCPPPAGPFFSGVLGLRLLLTPGPHGRARRVGEAGDCGGVGRWETDDDERQPPPIRPSSPLPHPVRGLLGNCDLNGC